LISPATQAGNILASASSHHDLSRRHRALDTEIIKWTQPYVVIRSLFQPASDKAVIADDCGWLYDIWIKAGGFRHPDLHPGEVQICRHLVNDFDHVEAGSDSKAGDVCWRRV